MQLHSKQLGIYIHIPFCLQKCNYCDFYSIPYEQDLVDEYIEAVIAHMEESAHLVPTYTVDTVYIGGGTPSILPLPILATLLKAVKKHFSLTKTAEITLEVNPASGLDKKHFTKLRRMGINRLSIGIQSANNEQLKGLGRAHTFEEARKTVDEAKNAKLTNISVDIMYGLPSQSLEELNETMRAILLLRPTHISAYGLTIEENTYFGRHQESLVLPDDETQLAMYKYLIERLEDRGFMQYEISNFAKDSLYSRHNMRYWLGGEYLGFGAAAHSFINQVRFSYPADAKSYIYAVKNKESLVQESERVSDRDRFAEYIMLRMRLKDGVDESEFFRKFNKSFDPYAERLQKYIPKYVIKKDGSYMLTTEGFFISNSILSDILE